MKKVGLFFLMMLLCFVFVGCGENDLSIDGNDNNDQNELDEIGVNKYRVEKKDNLVLVITNDGSAVTTTEYNFSNGSFVSAKVKQKYASSAVAKTMYDKMKEEPEITKQYVDISIDGNTITLVLKDEIVSVYKNFDLDTLYDLMKDTYAAYLEN